MLLRPSEHGVCTLRSIADLELLCDFIGKVAGRKIVTRPYRLLRLLYAASVECGKLRMECEKTLANCGFRILFRLKLKSAGRGQLLRRLHEVESLIFHHKLDDIARLATSKAMVEPLLRLDVEARGLFMMERAAGLVRPTCPFHLYPVARNQIGKICAGLYLLNNGFRDSEGHS